MKNQVLTIEQMQHLKELGVDTNKASCYWWYAEGKNYLYWGKCPDANAIPTFTLQDMFEMMPKAILINGNRHPLIICELHKKWLVGYDRANCFIKRKNLIYALYNRVCWLAEKGYIGGNK